MPNNPRTGRTQDEQLEEGVLEQGLHVYPGRDQGCYAGTFLISFVVSFGVLALPFLVDSGAISPRFVLTGALVAGCAWGTRAVARAIRIRKDRGQRFDFQDIARQCFKDRAPAIFRLALLGFVRFFVGFVGFFVGAGFLFDPYSLSLLFWLSLAAGSTSAWGAVARIRNARIRRKKGYAAYLAGDADAVAAVHRHALKLLRDRIRRHRERMLGPDSEWGRARAPLAEALDEAEGRIAYWQERRQDEPDSEIASLQLKTARRLHAKLKDALAEVDKRAGVLKQFYRRCEAKLAAMDRSSNDLVEVKRLEQLSGKADAAMAHARWTIEGLARSFVAEAQNIASALGGADRSQLGVLAGDAPIENIEYLADKIHESRERDRGAIEKLERTLAE